MPPPYNILLNTPVQEPGIVLPSLELSGHPKFAKNGADCAVMALSTFTGVLRTFPTSPGVKPTDVYAKQAASVPVLGSRVPFLM